MFFSDLSDISLDLSGINLNSVLQLENGRDSNKYDDDDDDDDDTDENEDIECTDDESLPLVGAATTSHGGDNGDGEILLLGHI